MKHKFRNLCMISFLAVAGIFGISSTIINNNTQESPAVEKADATGGTEEDRLIYVAIKDSTLSTNNANQVRTNSNIGDNNTYRQRTLTKTGHTYHGIPIWTGYTVEKYGGVDELQIQLYNGNTWKAQKVPYGKWTTYDNYTGKIYLYDSESWVSYSVDSYQIKCGSGSYVTMTYDEGEGLPSGVIGQFSATLSITAGESLTIQKNTGTWRDLSPSYSGDSNNYSNNKVLVSVSSAQIFLKYKSDGTYDVWVPGYTACAVVVGGNQYVTQQSGEGSSAVYDTALIYIDNTQTVAVSWNHNSIDTYLNGDSISGCFTGSDGTVTCSLSGAYYIRVHNNGYGQHNTLYITRDDAKTAKYLAQKFNTGLTGICKADGSTSQSSLTTAWNNIGGQFDGQDATIKGLFVIGSSDTDVANMMNLYRYVIQKYGTSVARDFLGKGYTKSAIRDINPFSLLGSEDNFSTIIIIISSSVALLSVTALSILVIRKRKSKEQE